MKIEHPFRLPYCSHSLILSQVFCTLLALCANCVFFSSPLFALDPRKRITQYDMRLYQAEHGLPMNDIKGVFQDSKGYIWLGCQEGLVRFDGVRFVLFDKKNLPGLREYLFGILRKTGGNLWLATNGGGVSCFNGKSIIATYDTADGL
jgi:ligand-binding sensor domain-containing protein